jgi:hypothetical protein
VCAFFSSEILKKKELSCLSPKKCTGIWRIQKSKLSKEIHLAAVIAVIHLKRRTT